MSEDCSGNPLGDTLMVTAKCFDCGGMIRLVRVDFEAPPPDELADMLDEDIYAWEHE